MKEYKIGDSITLPGAENKIGLIVTGIERDKKGNITGYNVAPAIDPIINEMPIIISPVEQ